jgi:lipopolysaccharide cholinephosphotransferase
MVTQCEFTSLEIVEVKTAQTLTDAELPHMDPLTVGLFYDLMIKVDSVFRRNNLSYWATCGTLLGAVRHQGMIPWDDDLDIAIFSEDIPKLESLKNDLAEIGLELYHFSSLDFYKIYYQSGSPILKKDGVEYYPWTYPFVDVFPLAKTEDKITYLNSAWRKKNPREYYFPEELSLPLPEAAFGPLLMPVPHQATAYLTRTYGADWNEFAYAQYSHKTEQGIKKVKVKLVNRAPPAYILPSDTQDWKK